MTARNFYIYLVLYRTSSTLYRPLPIVNAQSVSSPRPDCGMLGNGLAAAAPISPKPVYAPGVTTLSASHSFEWFRTNVKQSLAQINSAQVHSVERSTFQYRYDVLTVRAKEIEAHN